MGVACFFIQGPRRGIWVALFYFLIGYRRTYWDLVFVRSIQHTEYKWHEGLRLTLELTFELSIHIKLVVTVPFSNSPSFSIFPCVLWSGIHSVQHGGGRLARWALTVQERIRHSILAILFFNVPCNCPTLALESTCTSEFLFGRVMGFGYNSIHIRMATLTTYMIRLLLISDTSTSLPYILIKQ